MKGQRKFQSNRTWVHMKELQLGFRGIHSRQCGATQRRVSKKGSLKNRLYRCVFLHEGICLMSCVTSNHNGQGGNARPMSPVLTDGIKLYK